MKTSMRTASIERKAVGRLALATGLVLLIPLVATLLSDEVTWTLPDFVVAGALLFASGLAFLLVTARLPRYRVLLGVAILGALLWLWAELAVGVFTNWGS